MICPARQVSGAQAVQRAAQIIITVAETTRPGGITMSDVHRACGLPKATTSRMLLALETAGILDRDRRGRFTLSRTLTSTGGDHASQ